MPIADLLSTLTVGVRAGVTTASSAPPAFVCVNCGCQAAGLADGLCPRCVNQPAPHTVCPGCGGPALPGEVYCAKTPYGRPWCARRDAGRFSAAPATLPRHADLDTPTCWWCAAALATVVRSRDAGDGAVTVEGLCAECDRAIDTLRAATMATAAATTATTNRPEGLAALQEMYEG